MWGIMLKGEEITWLGGTGVLTDCSEVKGKCGKGRVLRKKGLVLGSHPFFRIGRNG